MEINLWHHQPRVFSRLKLINRACCRSSKNNFDRPRVFALKGEQLVTTGLRADGLSLVPPSVVTLKIDVSKCCETALYGDDDDVWDLLNGSRS